MKRSVKKEVPVDKAMVIELLEQAVEVSDSARIRVRLFFLSEPMAGVVDVANHLLDKAEDGDISLNDRNEQILSAVAMHQKWPDGSKKTASLTFLSEIDIKGFADHLSPVLKHIELVA